jgi:hypothetical protein
LTLQNAYIKNIKNFEEELKELNINMKQLEVKQKLTVKYPRSVKPGTSLKQLQRFGEHVVNIDPYYLSKQDTKQETDWIKVYGDDGSIYTLIATSTGIELKPQNHLYNLKSPKTINFDIKDITRIEFDQSNAIDNELNKQRFVIHDKKV